MRFKLLSLFLGISLFTFTAWSIFSPADSAHLSADLLEAEPVTKVVLDDPSNQLKSSANKPYLSSIKMASKNMYNSNERLDSIKKNQIQVALSRLPKEHVESIESIILDYSPRAHRGLGGGGMIILRGVDMSTAEFISVLIHEAAHNVDFGYLAPTKKERQSPFYDGKYPLYETDPSLDFYRISWLNNERMKRGISNMDFVSGYAMSEPHEDFAETYLYYVLHNKDFKVMATESEVLLAKYKFMKYQVFQGKEFDTGDGILKANSRNWDITVLSYKLFDFLT